MANGFMYLVYSEDGQPNSLFTDTLVKAFNLLRASIPDSKLYLYTNIQVDGNHWIHDDYGFDHVVYDENMVKSEISKAYGLKRTPFDKTVYLDVDTLVHSGQSSSLNDIFDVLDTWDVAAIYGNYYASGQIKPDINTGLLGVKNNSDTSSMMDSWITKFNDYITIQAGDGRSQDQVNTSICDQKSFRDVFFENHSKFYVLPQYFMFRWHLLYTIFDHAVITHGHEMDKQEILKKLIESLNKRLEE